MKILETDRMILATWAKQMLPSCSNLGEQRFPPIRWRSRPEDNPSHAAAWRKILPVERFGFGFYLVELKSNGMPIEFAAVKKETLSGSMSVSLESQRSKRYAFEAAKAVMDYGRTSRSAGSA
jgi:hypothetical protein